MFFVEEMGSFLSSVAHQPWPLCLFQDNQRKLCESSSEQMRSNHRFGRTIREHCSLNTLFIKCVQSTILRERCSRHCIVNMVYSTVFSLVIVKCTVQSALTIREPCSLTTPKMIHSAIKPLFTIFDQSL